MANFESDSEYDSDSDFDDVVYEPEEPCTTRFCIALCEIHNEKIHGKGPEGNYLVYCRYKELIMDKIMETADFVNTEYQYLHSLTHYLHPNYRQIILQQSYVKPEIVEVIYNDEFCVAIIKTFWIKIIQRAWKNVLKRRAEMEIKRCNDIKAILYRELHGKWPQHCYAFGGLKGLLKTTSSS